MSNGRGRNCTVVGNSATMEGGGFVSGTIENSIVWGNSAPTSPDLLDYDAWYTCAPDIESRSGNISDNPLFVDSAAGDFRLGAGSPCIDAGDSAVAVGSPDLAGHNRK